MASHVVMELLAYLDGELSDREQARVDAHLAECARCAAELEQLQTLRQELDATFDAAPTPVRLPAAAESMAANRPDPLLPEPPPSSREKPRNARMPVG